MKAGSFEFNLRELAGSMGDFGTLLPLTIGYIVVCKMNPAGLLVMIGLANIVTGLIYRLPMPIEPMKVLAVVAIAQGWTPQKVYTSGLVMGVVWLIMGATGAMTHVARWTPKSVVRGIQISLGILLGFQGVKMISSWWLLGTAAVVVVLVLRRNRYAPAGIVHATSKTDEPRADLEALLSENSKELVVLGYHSILHFLLGYVSQARPIIHQNVHHWTDELRWASSARLAAQDIFDASRDADAR